MNAGPKGRCLPFSVFLLSVLPLVILCPGWRDYVTVGPSATTFRKGTNKEITAGKGSTPKSTDTVTTHYRGTLIDGSEFDNSHTRGEPVTFEVSKVIPGWTEALQLMKVGAKWQLFVPANLAYGERSPGPEIPPNATLVFEIELLSIK